MPYDVSIIIVNWNGGSLLTRCIETIVSSAPKATYEIVVIDNASEDDSIAQLRANEVAAPMIERRQLRIINNADNRGFGAANNQAFALTDSPYLFLLNCDTEVRPGSIDTLIEKLNSDRRIGACGPKILNSDGSVQVSAYFNPPRAGTRCFRSSGFIDCFRGAFAASCCWAGTGTTIANDACRCSAGPRLWRGAR